MSIQQKQEKLEAVGSGFLNDTPSSGDSLGFNPYIKAVTNFIKDPATIAPLTISIEGDWGSGKSSFMKQLQENLKKTEPNSYSVWFDSWRYDREDGMWAAFALSFLQQISNQRSAFIRPWLRRKLKWKRLQKNGFKFWATVFRILPISIIDIIFIIFLIGIPLVYFSVFAKPVWNAFLNLSQINVANQPAVEFAVKLVPIFPWLIVVVKEFKGTISGLLETNLNKYVNNPKYEDHIELISRFHEDFKLMIENYVGDKRVYVFIDDLDRCNPGKAAELMQAINMMIHDYPQVMFIIAMDRKKVAAGYAMHHEKILPFLAPINTNEDGKSDPLSVSQKGLEYGYSYIEKFIQVPFRVPIPNQTDIKKLLELTENVSGNNNQKIKWIKIFAMKLRNTFSKKTEQSGLQHSNISTRNDPDTLRVHQDKLRILLDARDSVAVKNVILMISPFLDYNPRRIKQFVNIFRLYAFLSDELGLLIHNNKWDGVVPGLTLEQLGKIVAISLKWPQFMTQAIENERFLRLFLQYVYDEIKYTDAKECGIWRNDDNLIDLLRAKCENAEGKIDSGLIQEFGLNAHSMVSLFKVAVPVHRVYNPNNLNNTPPVRIKDMSMIQFMDLIQEFLPKYFESSKIEKLKQDKWGGDLKVTLLNGEELLVDIEVMFGTVDVHSIEYVKEEMDKNGISKGLVITNGRFEGAAKWFSGQSNIELWDGKELISILNRYGYNAV